MNEVYVGHSLALIIISLFFSLSFLTTFDQFYKKCLQNTTLRHQDLEEHHKKCMLWFGMSNF